MLGSNVCECKKSPVGSGQRPVYINIMFQHWPARSLWETHEQHIRISISSCLQGCQLLGAQPYLGRGQCLKNQEAEEAKCDVASFSYCCGGEGVGKQPPASGGSRRRLLVELSMAWHVFSGQQLLFLLSYKEKTGEGAPGSGSSGRKRRRRSKYHRGGAAGH